MSVKKMLFMVSTIIVLTSRFWGINTSLSMRYFIMAIWDLYFMLSYFSYREKTYKKYVIKNNFWLTIMPFVIFSIYTLIIWGIGSNAEFENFIKLCSTLLYLILAYGYACTAFYLFKAEGI
ncbi:TPA: hypothetical protein ACRRK4_002837, partial [Enterococcus faecium]